MNLSLIRWLINHREILTKCLAIAQKYDHSDSLLEKWALVNELAQILIPLFEKENATLELLWESGNEYGALSAGAELQALGVDWKMVINVLVPIILSIIRSLTCDVDDDE